MIRVVKQFDPRFEVGKKLRRFSMELSDPDSLLRNSRSANCRTRVMRPSWRALPRRPVRRDHRRLRQTARVRQRWAGHCETSRAWDLDRILSPDKPEKCRDDHRHHAIDALTVALSSTTLIRELARAAGEATAVPAEIILPVRGWLRGANSQCGGADSAVASSYAEAAGPLHEETFYSRPEGGGGHG